MPNDEPKARPTPQRSQGRAIGEDGHEAAEDRFTGSAERAIVASRFTGYIGRPRDLCHVCRKEGRGDVSPEVTSDGKPTATCGYHAGLARSVREELAQDAKRGPLTAERVQEIKDRVVGGAR